MEEDLVNKIAEALYANSVREAISKIDQQSNPVADMESAYLHFRDESDAAKVVLSYSYLTKTIETLIVRLFKNKNKALLDSLFEGSGALATSSAQINLCHAMGWIGKQEYHDLRILRKLRNEFAHDPYRRSLSEPSVRDRILAMTAVDDHIRPVVANEPQAIHCLTQIECIFLLRVAALTSRCAISILCNPVAHEQGIDRSSLLGDYEKLPSLIRRIHYSGIYAFCGVLHLEKKTEVHKGLLERGHYITEVADHLLEAEEQP